METNELIRQLAGRSTPVRRLAAPGLRAGIWFSIALPYVAIVTVVHSKGFDSGQMFADRLFVVEQVAAMLTAVAAAVAAFGSVVPGHNPRILALPLLPLAIWLATIGDGCVRDWLRLGTDGLELRPDWGCLPPAAMIGIVPAIAIVVMLRRGAPLFPRATLALAALAVAALGNFGLRFYHLGDASIMILVWHFGSVILLSILAGWVGRLVLSWDRVRDAALR